MNRRTHKLSLDAQRAIDALLDHSAATGTSGLTRVAAPVAKKHLDATCKLLALLDELPMIEPPSGLASRTIARIELASGQLQERGVPTAYIASSNLH